MHHIKADNLHSLWKNWYGSILMTQERDIAVSLGSSDSERKEETQSSLLKKINFG